MLSSWHHTTFFQRFTTGPKHKCVASALIKSKTSSNDFSVLSFPFKPPAKIKVPPWGIPWQSCVGIDVDLGILKAHEQVGSCLEKGQCLLQHRCSTTITWWGLRLFVSGACEAVSTQRHHTTPFWQCSIPKDQSTRGCSRPFCDISHLLLGQRRFACGCHLVHIICFSESEFISLRAPQNVD